MANHREETWRIVLHDEVLVLNMRKYMIKDCLISAEAYGELVAIN